MKLPICEIPQLPNETSTAGASCQTDDERVLTEGKSKQASPPGVCQALIWGCGRSKSDGMSRNSRGGAGDAIMSKEVSCVTSGAAVQQQRAEGEYTAAATREGCCVCCVLCCVL